MFFTIFLLACFQENKKEEPPLSDALQKELELLVEMEKTPSRANSLCKKFTLQKNLQYCKNISRRPHLWETPQTVKFKERKSGGPNGIHLSLPTLPPTDLIKTPPSQKKCIKSVTSKQCRIAFAKEHLEKTNIASECNALQYKKHKNECYFLLAEIVVKNTKNIDLAYDLCLESNNLMSSCIQHLSEILINPQLSALSPKETWETVLQTKQNIFDYWNPKHPAYTHVVLDLYWSDVMTNVYANIPEPTGDLLDVLPQESHRHIRSSLTYHIIKRYSKNQLNFEQWTNLVLSHLQKRSTDKIKISLPKYEKTNISLKQAYRSSFQKWNGISKDWRIDGGADFMYPATFFLKDARRATSDDEKLDVQILILESLYRMNYQQDIFIEALASPYEIIQFTAYRLMEKNFK